LEKPVAALWVKGSITLLFAEVTRIVVDDGTRMDYHIQFIDDPVSAGAV